MKLRYVAIFSKTTFTKEAVKQMTEEEALSQQEKYSHLKRPPIRVVPFTQEFFIDAFDLPSFSDNINDKRFFNQRSKWIKFF